MGTVLAILLAWTPQAPPVDPVRVDQAISKGVTFLKGAALPTAEVGAGIPSDELVLLTYVHAGVTQTDPKFQELLARVLAAPVQRTYTAALRAMVLEDLDRVKHQERIWSCAQFLVDNQCRNGQWSYGEGTAPAGKAPEGRPARAPEATRPGVRDFGAAKPKVLRMIPVTPRGQGPEIGDNSSAQYAALGLRACHDAGIELPREVLERAAKWWRDSQYLPQTGKNPYDAGGWCYKDGKGNFSPANGGGPCCKTPYASMTAGAAGSLVIYDALTGLDWKRDANVRAGIQWLSTHFSVTENPGWGAELPRDADGKVNNRGATYYYLYALERLGILYGTEKIGRHEWYPKGANAILDRQRPDGSWMDVVEGNSPVYDTCFAILFLKRATRPIASEDPNRPREK